MNELPSLARLGRLAVLSAIPLAGCSGGGGAGAANTNARPPVFGGQGAVIEAARDAPREQALAPEALPAQKVAAGPCGAPMPLSDIALVDDFEDGDAAAFWGFQREGYWFAAGDATEGAKLSPEHGAFRPERLPLAEAHKDNVFAAHLRAEGQKDWGAVFGVTLHWANKGIRCPLNLSGFAGVRFRAKGPGTVRVAFGIPETEPSESGGTCTSGCYDLHTKAVYLGDRWDDYFVSFDRLEQGGWGTQARFDPAHVVQLQFAVRQPDLPADFWLDDVTFVTGSEAVALAAQQHAQPAPVPPPPAKPVSPAPAPSPAKATPPAPGPPPAKPTPPAPAAGPARPGKPL
jgi:hypothetical protein